MANQSGNLGSPFTSITQTSRPYIIEGSKDDFYLNELNYKYFTPEFQVITAINQVEEEITGLDDIFDFPQNEDIDLIESESGLYVDPITKKTRAKLVFRVRNSSGRELLGVDARISRDET